MRKLALFCLAVLFVCAGAVMAQTIQVDVPVLGDTYMTSRTPDDNMGTEPHIYVYDDWRDNQGLVQFDVDFLLGMDIISATLKMQTAGCAPIGSAEVHGGLYAWDESTVTYNSYGDQSAYGAGTLLGSIDSMGGQQWVTLSVTDQVQAWADGALNGGFFVANGTGQWRTKEGCSAGPVLDVTYVPEPATIGLLLIGGLALLKRRVC